MSPQPKDDDQSNGQPGSAPSPGSMSDGSIEIDDDESSEEHQQRHDEGKAQEKKVVEEEQRENKKVEEDARAAEEWDAEQKEEKVVAAAAEEEEEDRAADQDSEEDGQAAIDAIIMFMWTMASGMYSTTTVDWRVHAARSRCLAWPHPFPAAQALRPQWRKMVRHITDMEERFGEDDPLAAICAATGNLYKTFLRE